MTSQDNSSKSSDAPSLVRGYTLALGIVATFFVLGAVTTYSMVESPDIDPSLQWAYILTARLAVAVAAIAGLVTCPLRTIVNT